MKAHSETPDQFRNRRKATVARLVPPTFRAITGGLPIHIQDLIDTQLESMYYHGWLDAYREFRSATTQEQNGNDD